MRRKRVDVDQEKKIGELIKFNRTSKGLTQAVFAKQLSMSTQQLQKYEMGINRVSVTLMIEIANILNLPIENFICSKYDLSNVQDEDYEILMGVSSIKNHNIKSNLLKFMHGLAKVA